MIKCAQCGEEAKVDEPMITLTTMQETPIESLGYLRDNQIQGMKRNVNDVTVLMPVQHFLHIKHLIPTGLGVQLDLS